MERDKQLIRRFIIEGDDKLKIHVVYGNGRDPRSWHDALITDSGREVSGRGVEDGEGRYLPWRKIEPNRAFFPLEEPIFVSDSDKSKTQKRG